MTGKNHKNLKTG